MPISEARRGTVRADADRGPDRRWAKLARSFVRRGGAPVSAPRETMHAKKKATRNHAEALQCIGDAIICNLLRSEPVPFAAQGESRPKPAKRARTVEFLTLGYSRKGTNGRSERLWSGEIRTRGLLVPNRRLRPTVFGSILAPHRQLSASLLTLCGAPVVSQLQINGSAAARRPVPLGHGRSDHRSRAIP
jgi:hypothetical protein